MTASCQRCGFTSPEAQLNLCPRCLLTAKLPDVLFAGVLELQDEIGSGAMGTVFRAHHRELDRTVAVKLLPLDLEDQEECRRRFQREAHALGLLNHPNIVAVHDFGEEEGQSFIVMEYVDGVPLSRQLPLDAKQATSIAMQVCDALAYAHSQGVIHRDIKPQNILVTAAGQIKVTDFGIARILRPDYHNPTVTGPGAILGTPNYMAPECLAGAEPDPRADLFSLAVVIYEMVEGRLPTGNFEPLAPPLGRVTAKAMALQPRDRHAHAKAMSRDLEQTLQPSRKALWGKLAVAVTAVVVLALGGWLAFHSCGSSPLP